MSITIKIVSCKSGDLLPESEFPADIPFLLANRNNFIEIKGELYHVAKTLFLTRKRFVQFLAHTDEQRNHTQPISKIKYKLLGTYDCNNTIIVNLKISPSKKDEKYFSEGFEIAALPKTENDYIKINNEVYKCDRLICNKNKTVDMVVSYQCMFDNFLPETGFYD